MPSHPKQVLSTNTKPGSSVIKMKHNNKRKNHKRKKQRIHEMQKMSNTNILNSMDNKADDGYNSTDANIRNRVTQNQMAVAQMWAKTYESMIRLQFQHRIQYWKNLAMIRNTEIFELRKKLQNNCNCDDDHSADTGEPSVKSTRQKRETDYEESESYLKFLEITLRHRQERKHKNREEDSD